MKDSLDVTNHLPARWLSEPPSKVVGMISVLYLHYTLLLRRTKMTDAVILKLEGIERMLSNIEGHLNRIDQKLNDIENELP